MRGREGECKNVKFFLLRHGQSEGNVMDTACLDPALTRVGREQISMAAERLKSETIDALYCSPLFRALQTAEILRDGLGREPIIDPVFCEVWEDNWKARPLKELEEEVPWVNLPEIMKQERWWPLVGETQVEIQIRAQKALQKIYDENGKQDNCVVLVTHGTFVNALIQSLCGMELHSEVFFAHRNGSLTCVLWNEMSREFVYINDVAHLPPQYWT